MPPRRQFTASRTRHRDREQRANVEDVIARIFRLHFGRQGADFMRRFRREFDGLDALPPNTAERVVGLWAQVIATNPAATRTETAAALPEALNRGGRDLREGLTRAAGVDVRNRRTMGRFLRAIGPSIFRVDQAAALRHFNQHARTLIRRVDATTREAIVGIVCNALDSGTPYTAVDRALIERFGQR